jgi:DNA-binding NarL/FixJ family response regulator
MLIFNIWLHNSDNKVFVQESIRGRSILLLFSAIIVKFGKRSFRSNCRRAAKITSEWLLPANDNDPPPAVINNNPLSLQLCIQYNLSPREQEVMWLMSQGMSRKQAAAHLHLSKDTLKTHLQNIYKKLEVQCLMEARNKLSQPNTP